jgi:predicted CXXCH cytochrome family protein
MFKRCVYGLLAVGLGLVLAPRALAYNGSYTPGAGINNSVHDLGVPGYNGMSYPANPADPLTRKCIWCHAPHNTMRLSTASAGAGPVAPAAFNYLPLWNHTIPSNWDTTFSMYDNGTGGPQDASNPKALQVKGAMTPGSVSLLCLSCHDGSIAVNSYGNSPAQLSRSVSTGTLAAMISPTYQIGAGKYLGNHHPIGFDWSLTAVDTGIRDADSFNMTSTRPISYYLSNGKMECSTCHSVHNTDNTGETLLWRSDKNSELCLTCHDKGLYTAP